VSLSFLPELRHTSSSMTSSVTARLLLIDDAEMAHDILLMMLAETGSAYQLTWRSDYHSGLEALLTEDYDLCLLDYQLGDSSGLELLKEARARGGRTPVIVMTGHSSESVDLESMRAGAADYLVKGEFTAQSLSRSIRYLIERSHAEEALRESEQRYALAMEGSNDGLWDWNVDSEPIHFSPRWKQILGFETDELPDAIESWWDRIHEDDSERVRADFRRYLASSSATLFHSEHRLRHKDGTLRHVLVRGKAIRNSSGKATRMAGSLTDVTLARSRDALTGLANRVFFLDRLEHAFRRTKRSPHFRFATLFLDLDRFKIVNDSLGHSAGDALLVSFARRLERCVRAVDTVARMGGDEFVVLLDDTQDASAAVRAANRIIAECSAPFQIADREVYCGASIGVALSSPEHLTAGELLRNADMAMYRAKAIGRGQFALFDDDMHSHAVRQLSIESDLRAALKLGQLEVFYQPIVDLVSRRPKGFEALVRWRHPTRGLVSPAEFISVAEESNLITEVDAFILEQATNQLKVWQTQSGLPLTMSTNTSRRNFASPDFVARVKQAIASAEIAPHSLQLEVTESLTMDSSAQVKAQLNALSQSGVQIYVDDFGIGYSSLSMLHTYPFTGIKLDRSFVSALGERAASSQIVKAVLAMAEALKLDVVAEGVETDAQANALLALKCPHAQGYLFSKPMSVESASEWLQSHGAPPSTRVASASIDNAKLNGSPHQREELEPKRALALAALAEV
jgi:diguanylate cyclase (GGDEF)-like protein/PAS domain S-box-containing protein